MNIQNVLTQLSIFLYYNPETNLWIYLNISKKFGFRAIAFHIVANKAFSEECLLTITFM